ncbi:MAG: S41 family peptidase [Candidatus Omnitrophica bacterium]|nr:S41 family peptidase [Candidatus Omnitrophota bacterium]
MKKKIILFFLTAGILISSCCYLGFSSNKDNNVIYKELDLLGEALSIVNKKYVEEKPFKDLIFGAIAGLTASLDSYSQFLKPEDYKELLVETKGKFGGLGIEITIKDGLLTIVSPIEDTPAFSAGLKAGDIIMKIEGEITKAITLHEAVRKLRGDPGTEITITILREEDKRLQDVTIVRAIIKIEDIRRALILEEGIGYIKLAEFRESTAKDLSKALKKLEKQGLNALILDLRNNPGGLLISAVEVSSRFLGDDKVVVSTKSRNQETIIYKSLHCPKKYLDIPMVVLINKGSASGSEIVAAALSENKRAILLGDKSFGKASVQSVIPLSDGSALRLTTAKYYTPQGRSIHQNGVEPHIFVVKEINESEEKEDVFDKLKKEKEEDFNYKKDYQLLRAVDLIRGLLVLSFNG